MCLSEPLTACDRYQIVIRMRNDSANCDLGRAGHRTQLRTQRMEKKGKRMKREKLSINCCSAELRIDDFEKAKETIEFIDFVI